MAVFRGMDVAMGLSGVGATRDALEHTSHYIGEYSTVAVRSSCVKIVGYAKSFVPVATGRLQRAITYRVEGTRGYVGVRQAGGPEVYWRFVEFGTRYVRARPFFRPAAEAGKGDFIRAMTAMGGKLERRASAPVPVIE